MVSPQAAFTLCGLHPACPNSALCAEAHSKQDVTSERESAHNSCTFPAHVPGEGDGDGEGEGVGDGEGDGVGDGDGDGVAPQVGLHGDP